MRAASDIVLATANVALAALGFVLFGPSIAFAAPPAEPSLDHHDEPRMPAANGELPHDAGILRLSGGTGWRHVGFTSIDWNPVTALGIGGWVGVRSDRPTLTPSGGLILRAGGAVGRWGFGGRASVEWLGGVGGGGRVPGVDLRVIGVTEVRPIERLWIHAGAGAMWLVQRYLPPITCVVLRAGMSVRLSRHTSIGAEVELPIYQLTGPEIPGFDVSASLWARVAFELLASGRTD